MAACASTCAPPSMARAGPLQVDVGLFDAVKPVAEPVTYRPAPERARTGAVHLPEGRGRLR